MAKRTKRVTVMTAAVLALTLAGAAAFAAVQPTLSLTGSKKNGAIVAQGRYDNPSSDRRCGPKDRNVSLFLNGSFNRSTKTTATGGYSTTTARLPKGSYQVQTFVQGVTQGGYGGTKVCNDAWSKSLTVRN